MKLKDDQNLKSLANFISFCLVVVGLILQSYIWILAALVLRSSMITVVVYHKDISEPEIRGVNMNDAMNSVMLSPRTHRKPHQVGGRKK